MSSNKANPSTNDIASECIYNSDEIDDVDNYDAERTSNFSSKQSIKQNMTNFKAKMCVSDQVYQPHDILESMQHQNKKIKSNNNAEEFDECKAFSSENKVKRLKMQLETSDEHLSFINDRSIKQEVKNYHISDDFSAYSKAAKRIMEKMNFKHGEGLGKNKQGITTIIETPKHKRRRGLGLKCDILQTEDIQWDFENEKFNIKEDIEWMPQSSDESLKKENMCIWLKKGEKKTTIDDETNFCNPDLLKNLLLGKSVFDSVDDFEMRNARTRSNIFETIQSVFFLNRAAMKMANIDSAFDFMFTNPKNKENEEIIGPYDILYFADICAGPGGFSEYILWRKKWKAKGFGLTLKFENDFKLEEFKAGHPETFEPFYGPNADSDGNIFNTENVHAFRDYIMNITEKKGVHFVMADGGFSVEGQNNVQEILSKRLYLCQFYCGLIILREDGHFVCKVFDLFTPFSVGLLYLLNHCFTKVCIFKPNTSRPANSERYIVCKWKKADTKDIESYFYDINCSLERLELTSKDVIEIVPLNILKENFEFFQYVKNSNERLAKVQITQLKKIHVFCINSTLNEMRQVEVREKCLNLWKIPNKKRKLLRNIGKLEEYLNLYANEIALYISQLEPKLTLANLKNIHSIWDFYCIVLGTEQNESILRGLFYAPWMIAFSNGMQKEYWYHTIKRMSTFDCPQEAILTFINTKAESLYWWWKWGVKIMDHHSAEDENEVHKTDFLDYITNKTSKN